MKCPKCNSKSIVNHKISQRKFAFYCLSCSEIFTPNFFWKQPALIVGLIASALLLSPLLLALPMQGLMALVSRDSGQSADTLVILGRGPGSLQERAYEAAWYWQQHPSVDIFVSGMTDAPEMIEILRQQGVPGSQIGGERCSQTTWENGLFTEYLIDSEQADRILLMTDSPHMVRSVWVFKGFGFKAIAPYPVGSELKPSLSFDKISRLLREYAALIAYGFSGKYQPEPAAQKQESEAEAQRKLDDWGCGLSGS
jgi:uncharacterized SAM-binding protein YcdF (DUF218 family)